MTAMFFLVLGLVFLGIFLFDAAMSVLWLTRLADTIRRTRFDEWVLNAAHRFRWLCGLVLGLIKLDDPVDAYVRRLSKVRGWLSECIAYGVFALALLVWYGTMSAPDRDQMSPTILLAVALVSAAFIVSQSALSVVWMYRLGAIIREKRPDEWALNAAHRFRWLCQLVLGRIELDVPEKEYGARLSSIRFWNNLSIFDLLVGLAALIWYAVIGAPYVL